MVARVLKAWWQDQKSRLMEAKWDWELGRQSQECARLYAQEVWDRRMKMISRVRLINGREIQLVERLKAALTEVLAQNAMAAAKGRSAPLEQLWSWEELAARLRQDEARGGVFKAAGSRARALLRGEDWSAEAKALGLQEAGYYFELFREDALLCSRMTETRMRALPAARELIAESRVRVGAPSLSALSRKDKAAGEALPAAMAERVTRRSLGLPDPLEGAADWSDLARLLMGESGESGPLRLVAPVSRPLMSDLSRFGEWSGVADSFYLSGAGYGWESFKKDAELCEKMVERQSSDALAARPIPGRGGPGPWEGRKNRR